MSENPENSNQPQPISPKQEGRRGGRRSRTELRTTPKPKAERPIQPGLVGGNYQPLSQHDMERIHDTALRLLEEVGMAQASPSMIDLVVEAGGEYRDDGRLYYPRALVEDVISKIKKSYIMYGQTDDFNLEVGGKRVHMGTGGAAPLMVDFDTGAYRESSLVDLYDIARLVDTLDNIHYFWRSVMARDMPTATLVDLNTTYACMAGTQKHIGVSYVDGDSVNLSVAMMDVLLGGEGSFKKRPICSISCCHVVPPLRFAEESCDALEACVKAGMPATLLSAAQAGATSPAALAGTISQAIAETLAGMVFCYLIDPECKINLGTWPFVSDLRTGAMTGGSGEQALLSAGCAQMAAFYNIPGSTASGMADSKVPDAQSGAEKAYTLALTAQAGATLIMESAGMQGSLMAACFESFVIDNDMMGSIQRTVRGIKVDDDTLSFETIKDVVNGEGHFLGHAQTMERMETDYFYPAVTDRLSPKEWAELGSLDMRERAKNKTKEVLSSHYPVYIDPAIDAKIRENFDIRLLQDDMKLGNGRW